MPVDGLGMNPGRFDRGNKNKPSCHFNLCISQLYKTFRTMSAKLLKINQLSFWLLIYILMNCLL